MLAWIKTLALSIRSTPGPQYAFTHQILVACSEQEKIIEAKMDPKAMFNKPTV